MQPPTPFFEPWRAFLNPLGRRSSSAIKRLRQATLAQIEDCLATALPSSLFGMNSSGHHSRERIFTLSRTVWAWLWQVLQGATSCREVVRQVQALFALEDAGHVDEGTSAYCQSRRCLSLAFLENVFATSFRSAERAAPAHGPVLLQGRSIRVVDGSGARLCDTAANRKAYPPSSNLAQGTGFPLLRMVVLFSLHSGALLAQASGSLLMGEWRLLLSIFSALHPNDILLGDRAYGNYVIAAIAQTFGVDLIASVATRARKVDFRRTVKRLGPNHGLFLWKKPSKISPLVDPAKWRFLPKEITVRLIRFSITRRGYRTQQITLVTTLLDPVLYPREEIIAVHLRRWRMEMCFDDIKTTLGMEQLRCQSPHLIQRELLIFLTAHNLVRWLMAQAASHKGAELERISFKGSLDAFRQWSQAMAQRRQKHRRRKLWDQLLAILAADLVPFRPGRREPRAVKKRSRYPHLNTPRKQFKPRPTRNQRRRRATARKKNILN